MTLKEMLASMDVWNNDACMGYAIIAMEAADMTDEEIARVIGHMHTAFDTYTVDEASKHYISSYY